MMAAKDFLDGKRVLLVDDEPDVLDTLADLLPMCETVKAANFKAAKDYLESEYFDLAILDIMGVEGYQVLEIANQRKVTAVMLTARALSPDNIVKSYREGAASYLPKEEMVNIAPLLNDVLEAKEQGKSSWVRWYDRMGSFFEKKFGPKWQEDQKDFWEKFPFH
jgi:DNA-binding NtrC family response regulator